MKKSTTTTATPTLAELNKMSNAELTKLLKQRFDGNSGEILNGFREMKYNAAQTKAGLIRYLAPDEPVVTTTKTTAKRNALMGGIGAILSGKATADSVLADVKAAGETKEATPAVSTPVVINKKEVVASNMTGKGLARKIAADKAKAAKKPAKKAAAPKPEIVKVTMLEHAVLMGLIGSLNGAEGSGYSTVEHTDLAKVCKLSVKSIKNVVSSLVSKGLVFVYEMKNVGQPAMDLIHLSEKAFCLHPDFSAEATQWIELEIADAKGNTTINIAKAVVVVSTRKEQSTKPYGKFGLHGHNIDVKGLKKGDSVSFDIKKQTVIGEFIHVHVNNHSPNGYAVIKYAGKIYERVMDKVNKVITAPKGLPAPKATPIVEDVERNEFGDELVSDDLTTKVRTLPAKAQKAVNTVAKKAAAKK